MSHRTPARLVAPALVVLLVLLAGALTCVHPEAEVHDYCLDNPGECDPCASDDQCLFTGNPCTDAVYCVRQGTGVAVVDIGCSKALERRWPDDDACVCVDQICQSEE